MGYAAIGIHYGNNHIWVGDEADEIFLLAKEFPISNEKVVNGKETLSSAKIDYLLLRRPESQKPQIILVELKTSNDSFNEEQLVRYRSYLGEKDGKILGTL